ncbi:hypothetical protein O181_001971 [Austropuccinia psidii MF-1]|uniref:Uncharacterized protein n=1 Tax=Austropuccinia psidii MF-1 TaxID=1389203 RepID=A0A9Q3BB58_9BASI|nr:hypothetical protein [Austropuccinia psidii MF-1]
MIQDEVSPKLAFIELQNNFKKSTRLMQLDIVIDLFEIYSSKQVLNSNDCFSKLFNLFDKYRHLGIPLSSEWKGLIAQVFAPIPHGMTRSTWFNCISSELDCSNKNDPHDIQKLVNSFMILMGQADQQTGSQSVMKLFPKNQVATKSNKVDALSSTMSNVFISSPSSQGLNQKIKSLHMPLENEIKHSQLNIKLGNRQPSESLSQKHGVECQYCKLQGLSFQGHWVSTCPGI